MILDPHKKIIRLSILLFILLLSLNYSAFAASWTSGGPYYVGHVNSLAMAGANPDIIYAGTEEGMFKTVNGGEAWKAAGLSDRLIQVVQVHPSNPDIVYAGAVEYPQSHSLYRSVDGGIEWTPVTDLGTDRVNAIAIDPHNPLILYLGLEKSVSVTGPFSVLIKSIDGGKNWQTIIGGEDEGEGVKDILIDGDDSSHIYVGLKSGQASGVNFFQSPDGGETGTFTTIGPDFQNDVVALAMTSAGSSSPAIYAIIQNDDVYKSIDGGESWIPMNAPFIPEKGPWTLSVDPNNSDVIFAGTHKNDGEVYKSTDGGNTWSLKANGLPDGGGPSSIAIDPRNSDVYVGFYEGGVYKSTDGGENWYPQGLRYGAYINGLAVEPTSSGTAFTVVDDGHLAKTTDGGASWSYLFDSPSDLGAVAIEPQNPSTIWAGDGKKVWSSIYNPNDPYNELPGYQSFYIYKSEDGGQNWQKKDLTSLTCWQIQCQTGVSDILIKADDSDVILVSMEFFFNMEGELLRTTDGGVTWQRVDGPTTTLAADPANPEIFYRGTKSWGYLYVSLDAGSSWLNCTPWDTYEVRWVRDIEVGWNNRVYVATSQGLWRWTGYEWTTPTTGLPDGSIRALAIDRSASPGTIYAGTWGYGVYVSDDGGSTWTPLNEGLENLYITKLAISETEPKILYAGTDYGGVWSLILEEPAPDTDGDGLPDDLENATCTDANNPDTDGDGLSDGVEDANHNGIVDPTETNPCDADSDDDGILDGNEDKNHDGIIDTAAGETDPCNPDTDGDGIYDGMEIGLTAPQDPQATDQSQGYFVPDTDPSTITDPTNPDTDGDGVSDGQEDVNHNGRVDAEETDPNNPDSDGDGYKDGDEVSAGSNPLEASSFPATTTIHLKKGFNLMAIPADVSTEYDIKNWLPVLGNNTEIEKVMVYDKANNRFVTLIPEDESNQSFTLEGGEGLIVYAKQDKETAFTSVLCSTLDLNPGFNLVGFACPANGYSAYQLLNNLGSENVSSIQRYSTEKGAFETAGFDPNGQFTGVDFPIIPAEGYFIFMK